MKEPNHYSANELTIIDVPVGQIELHPINDREDLDQSETRALADSIERDGQLTPCLARPLDQGRFQLIYGSRRFRAVKLAGIPTLRIDVREMSDQRAFELIGVENIHRRDFNQIELAEYLDRLLAPVEDNGAGLDAGYVALRFGKSKEWVRGTRRLLKLPAFWQDQVARGQLPATYAAYLIPHVAKEPIIRAVEASYRKNPNAWSHREAFVDQLAFVVHRFEKLQQANPGPIGGPDGRMVVSNRNAVVADKPQRGLYEEERIERQADKLAEELDAATDSIEGMPVVPLSDDQARMLLQKHWDDAGALKLIRRTVIRRINQIGNADQEGN